MEGKFSAEGSLFIKRGGAFKYQRCPDQQGGTGCDDWCPRLWEPFIEHGETILRFNCNDSMSFSWTFDKFTDERQPQHELRQSLNSIAKIAKTGDSFFK